MSASQHRILLALGRQSMSAVGLADAVDGRIMHVQHSLDALYRRGLVTVGTDTGRWWITERGRKKAAA